MVVLTIVTQTNGETVFFDEPFPKVHFMRLVSCSLYNSWHNLTRVGEIYFKASNKVLASIPQGYYTLDSIAKELNEKIKDSLTKTGTKDFKIEIETNKPNFVLKIEIFLPKNTTADVNVTHALAQLINTGTTLKTVNYIKKLNSPSTYLIHCDLIDKNQNFLNNKISDLLATFDVKGLPYEKVN